MCLRQPQCPQHSYHPSTCLFQRLLSPWPVPRTSYRICRVCCRKKTCGSCSKIVMDFKTQRESIQRSTEPPWDCPGGTPLPPLSRQRKLRQEAWAGDYLKHQAMLLAEGLHFGVRGSLQSLSLRIHICRERRGGCSIEEPRTLP